MRAGIRLTAGSDASLAMRASDARTASSSRACLTAARRASCSVSTSAPMDERRRRDAVVLHVPVDAHHGPLAPGDLRLEGVRRVGDLRHEPAVVDAGEHSFEYRSRAGLVEVREHLFGLALQLVGELLDEPGATERIGHMDDAGLLGDDLLRAQSQAGRVLGGERQRLVEGIGVQALGPAQHPGQRLERHPDQVDLGLLRGEGHARRSGCGSAAGTSARPPPRSARASSGPRCDGRPGTWRSPRRSRCGR